MDDDVRSMRARHWRTVHDGGRDLPETTDAHHDVPQFSHVAATSDDPPAAASVAPETDGSDLDEDVMLSQLRRRPSRPYAFVPPRSREGEGESAWTAPGAYPTEDVDDNHNGERQARTPKEETEDVDTKPPPVKEEGRPDEEERTCRICFSPATPDERLISPCKCRGTSKWIHLTCLNTWRLHSRNSNSFYRCDQCHYRYSFRRTEAARFLLSRYTTLLLTLLAFTAATFLAGFVVKFGLYLVPPERLLSSPNAAPSWFSGFQFFYTPLDAGTDMLNAASALVPTTPRTLRDVFVVDAWHFVQGLVSLGLLGIVTLAGTGGIFSLRTLNPRRAGRARAAAAGDGPGLADALFLLVILIGCAKVGLSLWNRVRDLVKRKLAAGAERILEVDPDRD